MLHEYDKLSELALASATTLSFAAPRRQENRMSAGQSRLLIALLMVLHLMLDLMYPPIGALGEDEETQVQAA